MKFVRLLTARSRWPLLLAVAMGLAAGAANMLALHALQTQIAANLVATSLSLAALFALSVVARVVLGHFGAHLVQDLAQRTVVRLRLEVASRLTATSLPDFEKLGGPRATQLLMFDILEIGSAIMSVPQGLLNAAIVLASLAYLGWLSPLTLGLTVVGLVAGVLVQLLATLAFKRSWSHSARLQVRVQEHVGALVDGSKELRLHEPRREHFLQTELANTSEEARAALMRIARTTQLVTSSATAIMWVTVGLVVFVGPRFGGASAAAAVVVLFIVSPFGDLLNTADVVRRGMLAYQRIDEAVKGFGEHVPASGSAPPFTRTLSLRGVEHLYFNEKGDRFRLGPIDLTLHRGELVFLVGGNGSGKTTLAKLLVGLYPPLAGELRVDDVLVGGEAASAAYRQLFSAIFSTFHVFPLLLDATPEREVEANRLLAELGLGDVVRAEGGRFTTTEMSTGQKKRFALACALLDDRPIYLFDEWAADQDPTWKRQFYQVLLPRLRSAGKTVIVVTHDDRYFDCADRVVKLESGQIIADSRIATVHAETA